MNIFNFKRSLLQEMQSLRTQVSNLERTLNPDFVKEMNSFLKYQKQKQMRENPLYYK